MRPIKELQPLFCLFCCKEKLLAPGLLRCCVAPLVELPHIQWNRTTSQICTNLRSGQKLSFSASDKQLKTPFPILRVLNAKKQVVEAHRSRKHNSQHAYARKFAIFHEKNGQKWAFFGQKWGFFASDE